MFGYVIYLLFQNIVLFILWYVVIMNGISILQMVFALFITPAYISGRRQFEYLLMGSPGKMIPVSLLTPAQNEEATIVESIRSMMNINYDNYEIVVINDGSTDKTLNAIISAFKLRKIVYPVRERLVTKKVRGIYYNPDYPRLRLIDKEHGGKPDALNAGINLSRYPYIVSLDADTIMDTDALFRIATVFMQNKYTIAAGGMIRVVNGSKIEKGKILDIRLPRKLLPLFQVMEYFRSFMVGRFVWNSTNSLLAISGMFGAFKKDAVLSVGGYTTGIVGEDMDLVIKLHRYMRQKKYKYHISFLPDSYCWTQVPESYKGLLEQRIRWQIGIIEVLGRYDKMFLNPRFGILGMVAMPYYFLFEVLSPIIEPLGYIMIPLAWVLGLLSLDAMILYFAAVFIFGIVTSVGSLLVEEFTNTRARGITVGEGLSLSFLSIAENLFYRQMTVFFRFMGILSYAKYKRAQSKTRDKKPDEAISA